MMLATQHFLCHLGSSAGNVLVRIPKRFDKLDTRGHVVSRVAIPGDSIPDLFGMVKMRPFLTGFKRPPTRGSKGHEFNHLVVGLQI